MNTPTQLTLNKTKTQLTLTFNQQDYLLSAEYLRVYSPSAEVRGHAPGQEILQIGKEKVTIAKVEPVGQYAVKLEFSDGHDTGIYSWDTLHDLSMNYDSYWQDYLARLKDAGHTRNT